MLEQSNDLNMKKPNFINRLARYTLTISSIF